MEALPARHRAIKALGLSIIVLALALGGLNVWAYHYGQRPPAPPSVSLIGIFGAMLIRRADRAGGMLLAIGAAVMGVLSLLTSAMLFR